MPEVQIPKKSKVRKTGSKESDFHFDFWNLEFGTWSFLMLKFGLVLMMVIYVQLLCNFTS